MRILATAWGCLAILGLAADSYALQRGPQGGVENDGPRGQYRGPTDEVLFASTMYGGPGAQGALVGPAADYFEGFNRWEFWFEINKDILLRSPQRQRRRAITPRPNIAIGGEVGPHVEFRDVEEHIQPALTKIAQETGNDDIRATALLALARIGTKHSLEILEEALVSERMVDRKFATLGLGMIDSPRAMIHLLSIFRSTGESQEMRAYAAIGMGLQGRREVIRVLLSQLRESLSVASTIGREETVAVAAVTALGMGEPSTRTLSVPFLVEKYEELSVRKTRSRRLLTAILTSLGKLQDPAALPTILRAMRDRDIEIRRAATIASGEIGSPSAVPTLAELIEDDGDEQTKGFACIALGKIASPRAIEILRETVKTRRSRTVQSFSALALGLARDDKIRGYMREVLNQPSEEHLRGAFAIALGMLRDQQSVPKLFEILESRGADPDLRGYAAIALGMIRPSEGHDRMLRFMRNDRERIEDVLRGVLLGLGLWEDPRGVPEIIALLRTDHRDIVRGHGVQALNMIRGRGAIEPLIQLASPQRGRTSTKTRVFAVAALGALGEKMNYPLYAETFYATNYRLRSPLMVDLMQYL